MLPYTKSKLNRDFTKKDKVWGGGLVRVNDDLDDYFSVAFLHEITELWNDGFSLEYISEKYNRNPDEIFLGLFHQAREDKLNRPFAYRKKGEGIL